MKTVFETLAIINIGIWIVLFTVTAVRFSAERHWRRRWFHGCGFHTENEREIDPCCRGCGQFPTTISGSKIMRATFWWGWEAKP